MFFGGLKGCRTIKAQVFPSSREIQDDADAEAISCFTDASWNLNSVSGGILTWGNCALKSASRTGGGRGTLISPTRSMGRSRSARPPNRLSWPVDFLRPAKLGTEPAGLCCHFSRTKPRLPERARIWQSFHGSGRPSNNTCASLRGAIPFELAFSTHRRGRCRSGARGVAPFAFSFLCRCFSLPHRSHDLEPPKKTHLKPWASKDEASWTPQKEASWAPHR